MPANSDVIVNFESPGVMRLGFHSTTPLAAGPATFVNLQANVPETAGYTTKQMLDLREVSVNEGGIPSLGDDAVHVVAYLGDVTGNDTISAIALTSGQAAIDYDFCEHEPACLSGFVYHDENDNGVLDNAVSGDGVCDGNEEEPCTITDANGDYLFTVRPVTDYSSVQLLVTGP